MRLAHGGPYGVQFKPVERAGNHRAQGFSGNASVPVVAA